MQSDPQPTLDEKQTLAIKCAHADLIGALQAYDALDIHVHDWRAHALTIKELEEAFEFVEPLNPKLLPTYESLTDKTR